MAEKIMRNIVRRIMRESHMMYNNKGNGKLPRFDLALKKMLKIYDDSHPLLRKTSKRVSHVDDELRDLVAAMYDSMIAKNGIGLAAIQVGKARRFFLYEIPERIVSENRGPGAFETGEPEGESGSERPDACDGDRIEIEENEVIECVYTGNYTVCINPRITEKEGAFVDDEGCLSKEGWVAKVERALKVTFQAYDLDMNKFEKTVTGMEARCVQHEIDHLDGILFTDRMQEGTLREVSEDEEAAEPVESDDTAVTASGEADIGG